MLCTVWPGEVGCFSKKFKISFEGKATCRRHRMTHKNRFWGVYGNWPEKWPMPPNTLLKNDFLWSRHVAFLSNILNSFALLKICPHWWAHTAEIKGTVSPDIGLYIKIYKIKSVLSLGPIVFFNCANKPRLLWKTLLIIQIFLKAAGVFKLNSYRRKLESC